jgi:hypothetical protein
LPETTFVLPPEAAGTDVRVRIFTPSLEAAHGWVSDSRNDFCARRLSRAVDSFS